MTVFEASVSLAKVCVGSGILALPIAVERGGLIFSPICLCGIAYWNALAVDMMLDCKQVCVKRSSPPGVNSTYSRVAYGAYGWLGVNIADSCLIVTLLGVCVTYLITAAAMAQDVLGFEEEQRSIITWVIGVMLYPLCCAEDIQKLSGVNLVALFAILFGVLSLFWVGMSAYEEDVVNVSWGDNISFPGSVADFTYYVGVASFCFGLCSVVFPVEESMNDRKELKTAVIWALIFVVALYSLVGDGLYALYKFDERGVMGNILQNLPVGSPAAFLVRSSIVGVCCLSFPFTFLPPAQMIEKYITVSQSSAKVSYSSSRPDKSEYSKIPESDSAAKLDIVPPVSPGRTLFSTFALTRACLIGGITLLATVVPCFGAVISLLGAFTVTLLTFVLPPLMHMELMKQDFKEKVSPSLEESNKLWWTVVKDVAATGLGTLLCIVGTIITFYSVQDEIASGTC